MKKLIIGAIVLVAIGTLVFGWDGMKSYVAAGKQTVSDTISENTSAEFEQARIKALLSDETEKVKTFEAKITGLDSKIAVEEKVIANAETDLAEHLETLTKARDLLKEDKDTYTINGKEYSKDQVNKDAQARIAYIGKLKAKIELHKTLVADLKITSETSKASLREALVKIQEVDAKLETLKARETNAQIKSSIAKMSEDMTDFGVDITSDSALQKALSNYERKIIAKESTGSYVPDTTIINYDAPKPVDTTSTLDQIDAVLQ